VHHVIGAASRVSFGKPEKLMELSRVSFAGSRHRLRHRSTIRPVPVKIIIDAALMRHEIDQRPPADATKPRPRSPAKDLLRFIEATGHQPLVLKVTA
jgi:Ala-tRNA(Pro) deacylase